MTLKLLIRFEMLQILPKKICTAFYVFTQIFILMYIPAVVFFSYYEWEQGMEMDCAE